MSILAAVLSEALAALAAQTQWNCEVNKWPSAAYLHRRPITFMKKPDLISGCGGIIKKGRDHIGGSGGWELGGCAEPPRM